MNRTATDVPHHSHLASGNFSDLSYKRLLDAVQHRFRLNTQDGAEPLFTTDVGDLFSVYLGAFPADERQYHNCHACRTFINRYGSLVVIGDDHQARPAMWDVADCDVHDDYRPVFQAMARAVAAASVTGVFLTSETEWGSRQTGSWSHFAVTPAPKQVFKRQLTETAGQARARKLMDFKAVHAAMRNIPLAAMTTAVNLFKNEALNAHERYLAPATWLKNLTEARVNGPRSMRLKNNLVWRQVALAPTGFCRPQGGSLGKLYEDITEGKPLEIIKRTFNEMVAPENHMRPKAAPKAGNINAAERLVEEAGIAESLRRRAAKLEELTLLWTPKARPPVAKGGVFGRLKEQKEARKDLAPSATMSWAKFQRTILPDALRIFYSPVHVGNYGSVTTASVPDAPPILRWDTPERRNPLAWYLYVNGSHAKNWGLHQGVEVEVTGITVTPNRYQPGYESASTEAYMFVLEGAYDHNNPGLALFPSTLKAELQAVRATIERFSNTGELEDRTAGTAAGVVVSDTNAVSVRVVTPTGDSYITIDRVE